MGQRETRPLIGLLCAHVSRIDTESPGEQLIDEVLIPHYESGAYVGPTILEAQEDQRREIEGEDDIEREFPKGMTELDGCTYEMLSLLQPLHGVPPERVSLKTVDFTSAHDAFGTWFQMECAEGVSVAGGRLPV